MSGASVGAAGLVAVLLAACGASPSAAPTWVPAPSFQGDGGGQGGAAPVIPVPGQGPGGSGSPSSSAPAPRSSAPSSGSGSTHRGGQDPSVVATRLSAPTGLAILPDGTALVGERTTGRIVLVHPEPGKPVKTVRTLGGLSTRGGGGLLDLALSPNYAQDNLIFAYVTTRTDDRVVDFTLTGPVTPVFTGIPTGPRDNSGRIAFGANGDLYIGTGDAGASSSAANPKSLAGKILRVTDIGRPAPGNPAHASAVFARGFRTVAGLCNPIGTSVFYETGPQPSDTNDPINIIGRARQYQWPASTPDAVGPVASLPSGFRSPGGCAIQGTQLYVTSLDGHALLHAALHPNGTVGKFTAMLHDRYGRLRTVVAAPDGALWLTTSNRDGHGHPIPADERVIRIVPAGSGGNPA